jgi:hypothetical protein
MTYIYTLTVDRAEETVGVSGDLTTLTAELLRRAQRFATITLSESTLAEGIAAGSSIVDLRLRPPQITARVRALADRT